MADRAVDRWLSAVMACNDEEAERLTMQWSSDMDHAQEAQLVQLSCSDKLDVRWWAIRALAFGRTPAAVATAAGALDDPQPDMRSVALLVLGHLHRRQPEQVVLYLGAMASRLADDEGFVRQTAVESLALCGDDAVVVLSEVMHGREEAARVRAAAALRKIGCRTRSMKAASVLFEHLNDPNYLVHSYCHQALDELGLLDNILVMP